MEEVGKKIERIRELKKERGEEKKLPGEEISISKATEYSLNGDLALQDKNFGKAIKCYQKAFIIYTRLAEQYKEESKVADKFKESRDKLNETRKLWKKLWAEELYNSGEKSITEGKHEEAIKYFEEAVKKNPKLIEAWRRSGNILIDLGNYEKAHKIFKEGLFQNPESPERWKLWNGLARLFLEIGEYPRAYSCLLETRELEKKYFGIDYNLGLALSNLEIGDSAVNKIKAVEYFEEAESKNPDFSPIKSALGTLNIELGRKKISKEATLNHYQEGLKKLNEAIEIENEAIEKDPNDIVAWYNKIVARYNKGLLLPILQEGKPKEWLKESNRCFDEVFRILERIRILEKKGEEKTEFTANVWYQKAIIWKYWSDFNPYREKGQRNGDLNQCGRCLKISLKIMKPLYEQKKLTEEGLEMLNYTQTMLTWVNAELKDIEEWIKYKGAKKEPEREMLPGYA